VYNNEEYLVHEAICGNQAAFTQLYDQNFDKIYRYIYFRLRRQAESEDLTQEVFIKALNGIKSYKMGKTPFAAWLFRIAHNQLIDFVRKNKKRQEMPLDDAAPFIEGEEDPVRMTEQKSEVDELMEAVKRLPPAQQEVISLRFISGLQISEVAQVLGKSEGTIKALQFNGTASLKKLVPGH
jgi:RNA polymerase sigma-70 factor (ECF subfamily)